MLSSRPLINFKAIKIMAKETEKSSLFGSLFFQMSLLCAVGIGITNAQEEYDKEKKPVVVQSPAQQSQNHAIREETLKAMRHYLEKYKNN